MAGLLDTQTNLAPFGANSIFAQDMAVDQLQRAQVNNDINQKGALQDLFLNEQLNPHKVKKADLENQATEAGLPGIFAESEVKQLGARKARETIDSDIKTYLSNNHAKMSDNDAKQLGNYGTRIAQMAAAVEESGEFLPAMYSEGVSPGIQKLLATPEGRQKLMKMGATMQKYAGDHFNKLAEIQAQGDQWERRVQAQGENALAVQELKNRAIVEAANLKKQTGAAAVKTAEGLYAKYAQLAIAEKDPVAKQELYGYAQYFKQEYETFRFQLAQASAAGTNRLDENGQIVQQPAPQPSPAPIPRPQPAASAPAPQARTIVRTGTHNNRKVIQYSDGTTEYGN